MVTAEIQQRTADQLFKVLGELKGGAMKFGQALSVFEAALPRSRRAVPGDPGQAAGGRAADAAAGARGDRRSLGPDWRTVRRVRRPPAAAASIGQVHQAVWQDGREVAVKIQYPGAGEALLGDLNQLCRVARLFGVLMPAWT